MGIAIEEATPILQNSEELIPTSYYDYPNYSYAIIYGHLRRKCDFLEQELPKSTDDNFQKFIGSEIQSFKENSNNASHDTRTK